MNSTWPQRVAHTDAGPCGNTTAQQSDPSTLNPADFHDPAAGSYRSATPAPPALTSTLPLGSSAASAPRRAALVAPV